MGDLTFRKEARDKILHDLGLFPGKIPFLTFYQDSWIDDASGARIYLGPGLMLRFVDQDERTVLAREGPTVEADLGAGVTVYAALPSKSCGRAAVVGYVNRKLVLLLKDG